MYQVESVRFEKDPILLDWIRSRPKYHMGEPLQLCGQCRAGIEKNRSEIEEADRQREVIAKRTRKLLLVALLFRLALALAASLLP